MELLSSVKIVLSALLKPLPFICIGLFIALCLAMRSPAWSRRFLVVSLVTLVLFSSPHTARFLLGSLENQYPSIELSKLPEADIAVLLTGSLEPVISPRTRIEFGSRADRLLLTQTLMFEHQSLPLLIAGAPATPNSDGIPEAEHSKTILTSWGVDTDRISTHNASVDTYETAQNIQTALPENTQSILLITSAFHMPRSMQLFAQTGLNVTPVTANHLIAGEQDYSISSWIPSSLSLSGSALALHEYLGMLANKLLF